MTQNDTKFMDSAMALAETLHFTKAAKRLRISQPQLTKNIQELEELLGFRLFDRDRKTVALNDAGRAYLAQSKLSIMYAERAFQAARNAMRDADTVIHVGAVLLHRSLLNLDTAHRPTAALFAIANRAQQSVSCELIDEILAGALDLAIATEPPESPMLTTVMVAESPFYIAMSKNDRLATHPSVTLPDLTNSCWILFERRLHPPLYDDVLRLARESNVAPKELRHITAPEEAFPLVEEGECVAFVVKAGALLLSRNGVTVRPLAEPALLLKTYLASRADNDSKLLSEFVRTFMRKLSTPKKDVQRAPSLALRRTA